MVFEDLLLHLIKGATLIPCCIDTNVYNLAALLHLLDDPAPVSFFNDVWVPRIYFPTLIPSGLNLLCCSANAFHILADDNPAANTAFVFWLHAELRIGVELLSRMPSCVRGLLLLNEDLSEVNRSIRGDPCADCCQIVVGVKDVAAMTGALHPSADTCRDRIEIAV